MRANTPQWMLGHGGNSGEPRVANLSVESHFPHTTLRAETWQRLHPKSRNHTDRPERPRRLFLQIPDGLRFCCILLGPFGLKVGMKTTQDTVHEGKRSSEPASLLLFWALRPRLALVCANAMRVRCCLVFLRYSMVADRRFLLIERACGFIHD